jgi:small subunit ribosomal protein S6
MADLSAFSEIAGQVRLLNRRLVLAEKRTYEIVFIVDPGADDAEVMKLSEAIQKIITDQGGSITKIDMWGRRQLAYEINHQKEGSYVLLEVEGSGAEIAELERRMRVNDRILRYMTIRVDLDRRRAQKFKDRRARKAAKRPLKGKAKEAAAEVAAEIAE